MHRRVLLLPLLLTACLGSPSLPSAREMLLPSISSDGTKFFVFRRESETRPEPVVGRGGIREEVALYERSEQMDQAISDRLAQILLSTGYCREGYFELARDFRGLLLEVRGECREGATEEDRASFVQPLEVTGLVP